jgi:hypothetical protein
LMEHVMGRSTAIPSVVTSDIPITDLDED